MTLSSGHWTGRAKRCDTVFTCSPSVEPQRQIASVFTAVIISEKCILLKKICFQKVSQLLAKTVNESSFVFALNKVKVETEIVC